jgi:purine-binding chemotaxis protein CheW
MAAIDSSARSEFLTFALGDEQYAIDILRVREIRALTPVTRIANAAPCMKGIFDLRGTIVPVFDMRILLGLAQAPGEPVVIILDLEGRAAGIVVDAVSHVVALGDDDVKALPTAGGGVAAAAFIRGVASIQDGMLVVLDIARLMRNIEAPVAEAA